MDDLSAKTNAIGIRSLEPIRTQSADGVTHEFPPGTAPEIVDKAMKSYAAEHQDKSTAIGQAATGFMDPVEGGGQLIANVIPRRAERMLNELNNTIADKTGLLRRLPEGGKNQQMAERETAIQKQRGGSQNIDWARMAGDTLNPVNYIGTGAAGAAIKGEGALMTGVRAITSGTAGGAVGGALQPVSDAAHYAKKKLEEIGLGGSIGGAFGAAGGVVSAGLHGLGSWVARNYPENLTSQAVAKILNRIKADQKAGGPSATDAIELVEAAKKPGPWGDVPGSKPVALADVGGENVQGLAGNVARQPGELRAIASMFLNQRDETAAQRLSEDINRHVSGGPTMHQATEGLLEFAQYCIKTRVPASTCAAECVEPETGRVLAGPSDQDRSRARVRAGAHAVARAWHAAERPPDGCGSQR